ncbi:MAG: hypothetical protein A2V70_05085 [Planctomycetes bacterium RBG_13_63_9]|nr:MAG: hypothetical protein A2V70_05085 [Planctomycetes bacterium RBG_13_63_9]
MSDTAGETTTAQQPSAPIRWRVWPAGESAARTLLVVLGLLLVAAAIFSISGQSVMTAPAMAALLVASWRYFLPVVFELDGDGVSQRLFGWRGHVAWRAVERYEVCSAGVLLLPDKDGSAMAPLRGLYLPWAAHREEVLHHVRDHLDRTA